MIIRFVLLVVSAWLPGQVVLAQVRLDTVRVEGVTTCLEGSIHDEDALTLSISKLHLFGGLQFSAIDIYSKERFSKNSVDRIESQKKLKDNLLNEHQVLAKETAQAPGVAPTLKIKGKVLARVRKELAEFDNAELKAVQEFAQSEKDFIVGEHLKKGLHFWSLKFIAAQMEFTPNQLYHIKRRSAEYRKVMDQVIEHANEHDVSVGTASRKFATDLRNCREKALAKFDHGQLMTYLRLTNLIDSKKTPRDWLLSLPKTDRLRVLRNIPRLRSELEK